MSLPSSKNYNVKKKMDKHGPDIEAIRWIIGKTKNSQGGDFVARQTNFYSRWDQTQRTRRPQDIGECRREEGIFPVGVWTRGELIRRDSAGAKSASASTPTEGNAKGELFGNRREQRSEGVISRDMKAGTLSMIQET